MLTVWETVLEPKPTAGFFWQEELPSLRYRGDILCWWRFNSLLGQWLNFKLSGITCLVGKI